MEKTKFRGSVNVLNIYGCPVYCLYIGQECNSSFQLYSMVTFRNAPMSNKCFLNEYTVKNIDHIQKDHHTSKSPLIGINVNKHIINLPSSAKHPAFTEETPHIFPEYKLGREKFDVVFQPSLKTLIRLVSSIIYCSYLPCI